MRSESPRPGQGSKTAPPGTGGSELRVGVHSPGPSLSPTHSRPGAMYRVFRIEQYSWRTKCIRIHVQAALLLVLQLASSITNQSEHSSSPVLIPVSRAAKSIDWQKMLNDMVDLPCCMPWTF